MRSAPRPDRVGVSRTSTIDWLCGVGPALVLAVTHALIRPPSQDFASGDLRARLFRHGAYLWNDLWFGGHSLPGYGIVSPALSGVFGIELVGVVTSVAAAVAFTALVRTWAAGRSDVGSVRFGLALFSVGCVVNLYGGRMTFGPAICFAVVCVLALQRGALHPERSARWTVVAVVAAVLCGSSSPVGALSLGVVLAGCWLARVLPRRPVVLAAAADVVPVAVVIALFPEGGWYPFTAGGFTLLLSSIAVVALVGRRFPLVRWTAVVYAVVAVGAMVVRSPLGGNVVRLGWLMAGPAAALTAVRFRRTLVPAFAVFTLAWNWSYVKLAFRSVEPSAHPAFYDSLARFVASTDDPHQRIEVVPTTTFRQADELAFSVSLARGWETQIDRDLNPLFYDGTLDAATFHGWLRAQAVSLVALPNATVQEKSVREAALIRSAPGYLEPVYADAQWQVFRVTDATPIVDQGARLTDVQPESLTIDAPATGTALLRFRWTPLYRVRVGDACVDESPDGWIQVHVRRPGPVRLDVEWSLDGLLGRADRCPA
jgi:hypothetical protein